ncbi:hypothetical protein BT63DRAFT_480436 [Microthyrium microscopicum]|uniref:ADP-ribosylation factor n=1 Tax=Microthyrium microscopicum TaxID=703497 RepID=A0A6A6U8P4_9PEZI|nr:hypothetical protein BT63DRAFT_480436 [Microthyrium microscopicum]
MEQKADYDLPSYYTGLKSETINEAVRNFDDPANLEFFNAAVTNARSRNFFLDFGDDEAWCGFDLEATHFSRLIQSPRPPNLNTRWINIWLAHEQKPLITSLAKYYDFSPRLLGFMCSNPIKPAKSIRSSKTSIKSSPIGTSIRNVLSKSRRTSPESSTMESSVDVEDNIRMEDFGLSNEPDMNRVLNQYALASDLWHYSTMDWGRRYVCLGYNTLHITEPAPSQDEIDEFSEDLPKCKRVWSWLVLCEDKTVIMIHEHPYPFRSGALTHREQRSLSIIRRNVINVFRQCSKARDPMANITPLQLPLRVRVGDSEKEAQHRASDVPGLLFYYLFDDWLAIYSLIARRDNRYAEELNALRERMLCKAELRHIDRLHHLGCQLSVLKRLYSAYDLLIDRLLGRREISLASLQNSNIIHSGLESLASSQPHGNLMESQSSLGVSLSSAAKVRFERLKHRIQLYALSEVNECIDQKASLIFMNFNLLAIKEAFSVERLTLTTLLLTKVAILFMPVSLMTAFFSCQFFDYEFSVKAYWRWFGGIFAVSAFGLAMFSLISGTAEDGKIITKPMTRRLVSFTGRAIKGRRTKPMVDE